MIILGRNVSNKNKVVQLIVQLHHKNGQWLDVMSTVITFWQKLEYLKWAKVNFLHVRRIVQVDLALQLRNKNTKD